MNLAIEYVTRNGLSEKDLSFPFSLFVYNIKTNNNFILTIQNCYGDKESCIVKKWNLSYFDDNEILPTKTEFLIKKNELTKSDLVIMEDFDLLRYVEEPYYSPLHQHSDEPQSSSQKKEFENCLNRFFNCKKNLINKRNILWNFFVRKFFLESCCKTEFGFFSENSQMEMIKELCPIPWNVWKTWLKYLVLHNENLKYSPELIFYKFFKKKLEENEFYVELKSNRFSVSTDFF